MAPSNDKKLGDVVRAMGAVLLGYALLSGASGALFAIIGVRLSALGVSSSLIGLVMSAYFVGLLVGSLTCERIIVRVGHIRAFSVFAATTAISVLLLTLTSDLFVWIALRAAAGYGMAGLYLIVESWLNHRAVNEIRARTFALYSVVGGAAAAAGPLLLDLVAPGGFELLVLTAILYVGALLPVALTSTGNPDLGRSARMSLWRLFEISPLGVVGCFVAGLVNSAFYGLGAVYGKAVGLSEGTIAAFMTTTLIGGLVAQFPIGWLADRTDRRPLLLALSLGAGGAAAAIGVLHLSLLPLAALGFTMDALSHPLYGLSVAQTNDYVKRSEFVSAAGGLLLAYAIGASVGPTAASLALTDFGPSGVFYFVAVVLFLHAGFTVYRMQRRAAKPRDAQSRYINMPDTASISPRLDPRTSEEAAATDAVPELP